MRLRKKSAVGLSPLSMGVQGGRSNWRRTRLPSRMLRRCSPGGSGTCSGFSRYPSSPAISSKRRLTEVSTPVPRFQVPLLPLSSRARRRLDEVADVHVVARLPAVAADLRAAAGEDRLGEDRDDARFARAVLPRAVDVGVAEDLGLEAVHDACSSGGTSRSRASRSRRATPGWSGGSRARAGRPRARRRARRRSRRTGRGACPPGGTPRRA